MRIKTYEPGEVGPQQSGSVGSLPGQRRSVPSSPLRTRALAGVGELGETLRKIGDQMQHAAEVQEYSEATVKAAAGMADIYRSISEDPQLAGAGADELEQVFSQRSAELREQIADAMKEHRAKKAFGQQYEKDDLQGRLKMRDLGRQRFISRARASTEQQLQALSDNLINTGALQNIAKGQAIIDGKVAACMFTAEEGRQLSTKFSNNAIVGYYERLIENPATASAAFSELTGESKPAALEHVDERTVSALVEKARIAAQRADDNALQNRILGELRAKYPNDPLAAAAWLEDPAHYKQLDFDGRTRLISYLSAVASRDRLQAEEQKKVLADNDRAGIFSQLLQKRPDEAVRILAGSTAIDSKEKIDWYEKIAKYPWKTSEDVYANTVLAINRGEIKDPDQIDQLRGRGLSNEDADKLKAKLDKPVYKAALDHAEKSFKLLYPAKDDLDKHLRWLDFVQQIDQDIATQNAERGKSKRPPLSQREAIELVDGYLTEQTIERNWLPDKTYRPTDRWIEGKTPFEDRPEVRPAILSSERRLMPHIPRDMQEQIADRLHNSGYKINARNINKLYQAGQKKNGGENK